MAAETVAAAILIVVIIALMSYAFSGEGEEKRAPKLYSINPAPEAASLKFVVEGSDFGDKQGLGQVYIGGERAVVEDWSDTSITCSCALTPGIRDAACKVVVRTEAGFSNHLQLVADDTLLAEVGVLMMGAGQEISTH